MAIEEVYGNDTEEEKERKRREREKEEEELKKKKKMGEEEEEELSSSAGSGAHMQAKALVSLGMLAASEVATATPNQIQQINNNDLTNALQQTPVLGMLKSLDPNFKLDPVAFGNSLDAWNEQHGNTPLNELSPTAISMHPLMQIHGVQTFVNAFTGEMNKLTQGQNVSPEMQAGLDMMNQTADAINSATPVREVSGGLMGKFVSAAGKFAAKFVMKNQQAAENFGQAAAAIDSRQPGEVAQASGAVGQSLINVGMKLKNKLGNLYKGPATTPAATASNNGPSKLATSLNASMKSMKPTPPTGETGKK
jgi:hypothetical protein